MTINRQFEIINERGLHARASAKLVELVEEHNSDVRVTSDGVSVSGDSIMGPAHTSRLQGYDNRCRDCR